MIKELIISLKLSLNSSEIAPICNQDFIFQNSIPASYVQL